MLVDYRKLSSEQKCKALRALSFLKEKRDNYLIGRAREDGKTHQQKKTKADPTLPVSCDYSALLASIIDSREERTVGASSTKGVYLRENVEKTLMANLEGDQFDITHSVIKDCTQHVMCQTVTRFCA